MDPPENIIRERLEFQRYMIDEKEAIEKLAASNLEDLGSLLSPDLGSYTYRKLAYELGVDNKTIDAIMRRVNAGRTRNPGYDVLCAWKKKPASTIKVLLWVLKRLEREDVIQQLNIFRYNMVHLDVVLIKDSTEVVDLCDSCPGKMQIATYIRRQIQRKMPNELLTAYTHHHSIVIQMRRSQIESDVDWSSPIKRFQGQDIKLEELVVDMLDDRRNQSERQRRERVRVERLAISESIDVSVFFEIIEDRLPDETGTGSTPPPIQEEGTGDDGEAGEAEREIGADGGEEPNQGDNGGAALNQAMAAAEEEAGVRMRTIDVEHVCSGCVGEDSCDGLVYRK